MNEMRERVCLRLKNLGLEVQEPAALDGEIRRAWEYLAENLNLRELPEALETLWADMAAGYFLQEQQALGKYGDQAAVRSITEGDISLSYQSGGTQPERLAALIERLTSPPESRLAAYRRVRW